jgi:hypothetical protein
MVPLCDMIRNSTPICAQLRNATEPSPIVECTSAQDCERTSFCDTDTGKCTTSPKSCMASDGTTWASFQRDLTVDLSNDICAPFLDYSDKVCCRDTSGLHRHFASLGRQFGQCTECVNALKRTECSIACDEDNSRFFDLTVTSFPKPKVMCPDMCVAGVATVPALY